MSQAADPHLLCGRFRRRPPGLGQDAPPTLRPLDPLLPVRDQVSGRKAWLLPVNAKFVGNEADRSYFMMSAMQVTALRCERAIVPAFIERDEHWFWIGYWEDDLKNHPLDHEQGRPGGVVDWALGVARNLQELHELGKQHGLLQPSAVVRSVTGEIRVWGGAILELFNKERLAQKAQREPSSQELPIPPAILRGEAISLRDELGSWALSVACRWFDLAPANARARLAQERFEEGWGRDLAHLLQQCLGDPQAQGIQNVNDLVTRLEVLNTAASRRGLSLVQGMQAYQGVEGSMPSLENVDLGYEEQGGLSGRPVTSANGPGLRTRPTRRSAVTAGTGILGDGGSAAVVYARGASRKNLWLWLTGVVGLLAVGGVAAWFFMAPMPDSAGTQAQEASGDSKEDAKGALVPSVQPQACPPQAERLPSGACMDRFEYPGEGKRPRVSLTKNQAELLCHARQGRLCQVEEWRSACALGSVQRASCQLRHGRKKRMRLRKAGKSKCVHAGRFYDLLGNAAEWVLDGSALGGDIKTHRSKASCDQRIEPSKARNSGFSLGFRCCYGPLSASQAETSG